MKLAGRTGAAEASSRVAVEFRLPRFQVASARSATRCFGAYASLLLVRPSRSCRQWSTSVDDSPRDWRHETVDVQRRLRCQNGSPPICCCRSAPPASLPNARLLPWDQRAASAFQRRGPGPHERSGGFRGAQRPGHGAACPTSPPTSARDGLEIDFPAVTTEFRDHVIVWSQGSAAYR